MIGISLYPDISKNIVQEKEYLKIAYEFGFTRLFMCLLNLQDEESFQRFIHMSEYAKQVGYEIIFDVSPSVMKQLNISYDHLQFFLEIGAYGIRLDESFDGIKEAKMSYNPENLKIELNASTDMKHIEKIMLHHPNMHQLLTCHNYYPLRYTGLSDAHFHSTTRKMKEYHLRVAAFVTSQNDNTFGPWPINDGLCTLEKHRDLPIDVQVKHLLSLGIDDILIGNAYASSEELKACQQALIHPHSLHLEVLENSVIEDKIIDEIHTLRPDKSDYVARSTSPRIKYQKYSIFPKDNQGFHKGDVVILNDISLRYKGELQIILQEICANDSMNLVGRIPQEEHLLLKEINTWDEVIFIRKD